MGVRGGGGYRISKAWFRVDYYWAGGRERVVRWDWSWYGYRRRGSARINIYIPFFSLADHHLYNIYSTYRIYYIQVYFKYI